MLQSPALLRSLIARAPLTRASRTLPVSPAATARVSSACAQPAPTSYLRPTTSSARPLRRLVCVGPAPDGDFIRQLPQLELASGNYWKGLESIIISHTADESEIFVDGQITDNEQFSHYLGVVFPTYTVRAGLNDAIERQYPKPGFGQKYGTQQQRVKALVRDVSFTCNTRFLAQAYNGRSYNMQYSVTPGWHATDLLPLSTTSTST